MLHGFPLPYPDELFWSLLARFAGRFQSWSQKTFFANLFGTATVLPSIDFPSHLRTISSKLLPGHPCTADVLLRDHSCYPWFAPFLPSERAKALREGLLGRGSSSTWTVAGLTSGRIKTPEYLRFCPACLREDLTQSRELHWRRLHQFAGIVCCTKHSTVLAYSSTPRIRQFRKWRFELPSSDLADVTPQALEDAIPLRIAKLGEALLTQQWPCLGLEALRNSHLEILVKHGLAKRASSIRVDIGKLLAVVQSNCSAEYLKGVGCVGQRWIEEVVRKNESAQPPIRHLLLLACVGEQLQALLEPPNPQLVSTVPIERAAITCQNHLCPARNNRAAAFKAEVFCKPLGGMVEVYECPTCGQVQRRCTAGHERIWVREYGFLWHAKLKALWHDPSQGYREMSKALGRSSDTIKSQAIKAGLPIPRPGETKTSVRRFRHLLTSRASSRDRKIAELRRKWLDARRIHPNWNSSQLRRSFPAVYGSLYRYDWDWLMAHQPVTRRWWPKGIPRCDWPARDAALAHVISAKAKALKSRANPGNRLTPLALAKAVGIDTWLNSRLDKLPKSRWALINEADTTVDFAMRHVVRMPGVDAAFFQLRTIPPGESRKAFRTPRKTLVREGKILLLQVKIFAPDANSDRVVAACGLAAKSLVLKTSPFRASLWGGTPAGCGKSKSELDRDLQDPAF